MQTRPVTAILLALALVAAETRDLQAAPIAYSLDLVASARLAEQSFHNAPISLAVFTDTEPISIDGIVTNVDSANERLTQGLIAISTITGVLFVIGSLFKFHQHKQNPQQVEI